MKNLKNKWQTAISFHILQWSQNQVNYPHLALIKAWNMSQTRGIG